MQNSVEYKKPFTPDWDQLEACRDSLREHMQVIKIYRATLEGVLKLAEIEAREGDKQWAKVAEITKQNLAEIIKQTLEENEVTK